MTRGRPTARSLQGVSTTGRHLAAIVVTAIAVIGVLSACTLVATPATNASTPRTVDPTPSATSSDDRPRNDTGEYVCGVGAISAVGNEDRYLGYAIPTLHDRGPREGANGTATLDETGQPVAYVVAAGDTFEGVEVRFCTPGFYLEFVNSIRRGTLDLYTGDTVNLSAYTITSVGDVNGVVHHYPVWRDGEAELPPQR